MSLELNFGFVNQHRGRPSDFLDRYELAAADAGAADRASYEEFCDDLLGYISDERNLMIALNHLRLRGGGAPGTDGEKLVDMGRMAGWALVRSIRNRLREDTYERGPLRRCRFQKHPGSPAKRTIWVANVSDRIASRGAAQVVVPLLEPAIDLFVYSWRRRGAHAALADAVHQVYDENRIHWITEDLRNAFDEVPRERLRDILRRHVPNDKFCSLVIDLAARPSRRGVLQGSALSSALLDLYLSHFLHRPWRRNESRPPLKSYVDDLWVGCTPGEDSKGQYRALEQFIRTAGLRPKFGREGAICDLTKQTVTWLGFRLRLVRDELRIRSAFFATSGPERHRQKHQVLVGKFARLHERPAGWRDPNSVIRGIVTYLAPTLPYDDPQRIYKWITQAAADAGFQEIFSFDETLAHWTAAHGRWMARLTGSGNMETENDQHAVR